MAASVDDVHPIPDDLAKEILQQLPVESLLRFKCVCKSWYTLINSHSFISKHYNYHGNNKRPKLLICDHDASDDSIAIITLISDSEGTPLIETPHHLSGFAAGLFLVGPVDGVFLFLKGSSNTEYYDPKLGLWNPATRMVTTLPAPHFQLQPFFDEMGGYCGFGFDPFTSNYKVVWVRQFWDKNYDGMFHRAYAAVYSFSNDSWRILKHKYTTFCNYDCSDTVTTGYLNGAYYWMINGKDYCGLLSFDFHNEVFSEIRGPDIPPIYNCHSVILIDGSIYLLARGFITDFALWVMIQPGVWNKLLTFQCLSLIQPRCCGFWDSTTVIFLSESSGLISYDVNTQETRHLGFQHQVFVPNGIGLYDNIQDITLNIQTSYSSGINQQLIFNTFTTPKTGTQFRRFFSACPLDPFTLESSTSVSSDCR